MDTIPLITGNKGLYTKIAGLVQACAEEPLTCVRLKTLPQAVEYLNIEMPELVLLDLTDKTIDAFALLETIMADSWLLHGGIIALANDSQALERIESMRGLNLIVDFHYDEVRKNLPRVLTIVFSNRRIIFQRNIGTDIVQNISGSFKLNNDPLEVTCYVNLICNFLYNANKLDIQKKYGLQLAINELLINAIEHGNCSIDYNEKSAWMEKHGTVHGLIRQRNRDPVIAAKKVLFEYTITPSRASFVVCDQGNGFDWRAVRDARESENLFKMHGRGILMTKAAVQNLTYNDTGNEVRFDIEYQSDTATLTPGLFKNIATKTVRAKDTIFREGEPSNFLYYIVKGRYTVTVNGKQVSCLTPDDIFVGEMSFLLNNRRSATVQAETDGVLIEVSKREFVEAIKANPHYALFLARLLARRIQRLNQSR